MKNQELAKIFEEMADVYELLEVEWKPRAYRRASQSIAGLRKDVALIFKDSGVKGLDEIPGVGKSIAEKIAEFLKTGKVKEHQKLLKKVPKGVEELMHIPGMGPKRAMLLSKKLRIKSLADLEKAAKSGKISKLQGFGKKSETELLQGLGLVKKSKSRSLLGKVLPIARSIQDRLKQVKGVEQVELGGSLRRMKETIGDIDLLVLSKKSEAVMDAFTKHEEVKRVLARGKTKASVRLKDGTQADVRVVDAKSFGAALQYFTGNKEHNVELRKVAIKKGLKLNEYGLFKGDKYVCGRTEAQVYKKLGFAWIPPEMRENQGELELAKKGKIPSLIELKDVKGDLQMHTKHSDGVHTIEQMATAAQKLGHKYIAITDHSKSERIANGMDEKRLKKYLAEIDKVNKKTKITILKSAEVDILADGSLDYSDAILKKLDFVLVSVHSRFKSSEKEMTKRIKKALENPYVNAFAHPTGRVIYKREGYKVNWPEIFDVAKAHKVALEINGHPQRLDLPPALARDAVKASVKISFGTDAHAAEQLSFIEYCVGQARRGWVQKKDVINTMTLTQLKKFLRK